MSDSDEDRLRINTLHRFAKRSSRLVLQEYSHCEVPAGCGGYVFRWRDPAAGLPVVVHVACHAEASLWIDGKPRPGTHTAIPFGECVLALHLRRVKQPAVLALVITLDHPERSDDDGDQTVLASAGSVRWRATVTPPDETWTGGDFDDGDWSPLAAAELDEQVTHGESWRYEYVVGMGAEALRLPGEEVWIRARFLADATLVADRD